MKEKKYMVYDNETYYPYAMFFKTLKKAKSRYEKYKKKGYEFTMSVGDLIFSFMSGHNAMDANEIIR